MERRLVLFLLFQFLFFSLQAQYPVQEIRSRIDSVEIEDGRYAEGELQGPWSFTTTFGSSFGFSPYMGSAMSMFIAPQARYSVTKGLTFHGGIVASQFFPTPGIGNSEFSSSFYYPNLSAFVAASYRLTSGLLIYGTGVKSLINPGMPGSNANFAMDDFSIGAAYSIGNFTIGASFHSGNTNPYRASPFNSGRGMYNSPFYW